MVHESISEVKNDTKYPELLKLKILNKNFQILLDFVIIGTM